MFVYFSKTSPKTHFLTLNTLKNMYDIFKRQFGNCNDTTYKSEVSSHSKLHLYYSLTLGHLVITLGK